MFVDWLGDKMFVDWSGHKRNGQRLIFSDALCIDLLCIKIGDFFFFPLSYCKNLTPCLYYSVIYVAEFSK